MIKTLIIVLVLFSQTICKQFTKYSLPSGTGARCLDGSPTVVYVSKGTVNSTVVFFSGNGYCEGTTLSTTLQSCYKRSKNQEGSSTNYPNTYDLDTYGILSSNQTINPNFWNWTKAYLPYCDGSLFQGSRAYPISYKDTSLYFRGTNNTLATFELLNQKFDLYSSNTVVMTGESAGGIAVYLWSNYLFDKSKSKNVYAVPDSGLFITKYPNPITKQATLRQTFSTLFKIVNNQTHMPLSQCVTDLGNSMDCFEFGELVKYFKAPMFIIESQYDRYSIQKILGLTCLSSEDDNGASSMSNCTEEEMKQIDAYRNSILIALKNFTLNKKKIGIWALSCVQHSFIHVSEAFSGNNYKIPSQIGMSISSSIAFFINNSESLLNIHIDTVNWPNNKGCANYQQKEKSLFNQLFSD